MKKFQNLLSGHRIYCRTAHKADDQPVGKTDDLGSTAAHAPCHAVMIRTVCCSDTDLSVLYSNSIFTALIGGDQNFTVDVQIKGPDRIAVADDLNTGSVLLRKQQRNAQANADNHYAGQQG